VIGEALSYAWGSYWKNVGPMFTLALIVFLVNIALGFVANRVDDVLAGIVIQVAANLFQLLLAMGLVRAALAVCEGRAPDVNLLFQTPGYVSYVLATLLFAVIVGLGLIAFIIPGIIFGVMFHLYGFAVVQNPDLGPVDALRRSADLTRGHRWQLFGLGLLLFALNIVGVLACVIGVVVTYGISAISLAYAYKALAGEDLATW
jgi:uncharacterized membrane protein